MSQTTQVLKHLQSKKSLTPLEGLRKYGTLRLAAIVFNLRADGHNIITENKNVGTKKKPKYVANYKLLNTSK